MRDTRRDALRQLQQRCKPPELRPSLHTDTGLFDQAPVNDAADIVRSSGGKLNASRKNKSKKTSITGKNKRAKSTVTAPAHSINHKDLKTSGHSMRAKKIVNNDLLDRLTVNITDGQPVGVSLELYKHMCSHVLLYCHSNN